MKVKFLPVVVPDGDKAITVYARARIEIETEDGKMLCDIDSPGCRFRPAKDDDPYVEAIHSKEAIKLKRILRQLRDIPLEKLR